MQSTKLTAKDKEYINEFIFNCQINETKENITPNECEDLLLDHFPDEIIYISAQISTCSNNNQWIEVK